MPKADRANYFTGCCPLILTFNFSISKLNHSVFSGVANSSLNHLLNCGGCLEDYYR